MAVKESERKYKSYKRLTQEQIELIYKLFGEKMEQRKTARALGASYRTVPFKKTNRI